MLEIAVIIAAECALLAAIAILREPKLLILAVIVGLPVEYFGTQTLGALGQSGVAGAIRALLNPGKLAMLATIGVVIIRERHTPGRLIPNSSVVVPILVLLALTVLGVAWSDSLTPSNAVLILPMYVAFVFTAPTLIEDRRDVERIVGTFLLVCIGLSLIAIAQRLFGVFNWRAILIQSDGYSYRSNATFADPNHLARYMALCISLAVGLILATGPRRTTIYLAVPLLVVTALGIVVTASRSGWGLVIFCSAIVVFAAPIARYTKAKLVTAAGTALVLLIALLLVQGGENAQRVASLASPVTALGQREFLIRVGWQEFLDNPFIGVGSGNYQHALITTYRSLVPDWAEVTLSHTSLVSIIAEWGILGLAMFLFITVRLAAVAVGCYRRSSTRYIRLISAWLGAALLGIVLHSQSEGRLFDEPYLYLLLAILVAIETGPRFARKPAAEAETAQQAPVVTSPLTALEQPVIPSAPVATRVAAGDAQP
jgi:putative inorganic carbon (hco3(-)) transporter